MFNISLTCLSLLREDRKIVKFLYDAMLEHEFIPVKIHVVQKSDMKCNVCHKNVLPSAQAQCHRIIESFMHRAMI